MSRTLRQHRRRQLEERARRRKLIILGILASIVVAIAGGFTGYHYLKGSDPAWPTIKTLRADRIGQNSVVYAIDGTRMGVIPADQNRTVIPLSAMGEWAPRAVVAIEDRRFFDHHGVDPQGILRAAFKDAQAGSAVEGGSTLTQQVVRNLYSEVKYQTPAIRRKAKEATLAWEMEDTWPKDRILSTYMNIVFFGNNAYGIEAAAQTYFSKHARALTLPEAALLGGLPQAPSVVDPFTRPDAAVKRRNEVLKAMLDQRVIDRPQYTAAIASPLHLRRGKLYQVKRLPYLFDFVQQQLIREYGESFVREGGLQIHTTISPRLQILADRAIRDTLNQPGDPEAAMVVLDTKSGKIRAMSSSRTYEQSKFNIAAQGRRQPGSTAKVWVLATYVRQNIDPESTYMVSHAFKVRAVGSTDWWEPKTYSNSYGGSMSIANATIQSDNSVFAQLTLDQLDENLQPTAIIKTAHDLGIESTLQPVWSLGLGSQVVTPLEQTTAFSTIARGGMYREPTGVEYITGPSGGRMRLKRHRRPTRVLEDWQAAEIIDILHRNVLYGTGTGSNFGWNQAGKTGTTDDLKDAWFCGVTPELTACVWMGYNIPSPMYSVHGTAVAGGTFPATMWRRFMEPALAGKENRPWPEVHGSPQWVPWHSTWQSNPSLDKTGGAAWKPVTNSDPAKTATTTPEKVTVQPATPASPAVPATPATPAAPVAPTAPAPTPGT